MEQRVKGGRKDKHKCRRFAVHEYITLFMSIPSSQRLKSFIIHV